MSAAPLRRRLLLGGAAALLARCGGAPKPPPPAELTLTIRAGRDQNPETNGKPAPVGVLLLQLAATGAFERADVFALTERTAATLGADLLQSEQIVLAPGETRVLKRLCKPGTQFLGVAVLFRDIDHAAWRASAPVAANGPTARTLTIGGIRAVLA